MVAWSRLLCPIWLIKPRLSFGIQNRLRQLSLAINLCSTIPTKSRSELIKTENINGYIKQFWNCKIAATSSEVSSSYWSFEQNVRQLIFISLFRIPSQPDQIFCYIWLWTIFYSRSGTFFVTGAKKGILGTKDIKKNGICDKKVKKSGRKGSDLIIKAARKSAEILKRLLAFHYRHKICHVRPKTKGSFSFFYLLLTNYEFFWEKHLNSWRETFIIFKGYQSSPMVNKRWRWERVV